MKRVRVAVVLGCLLAVSLAASAGAQETLRVAIGHIDNWENQMPTLGQQAGFFKKRGLLLENIATPGSAETLTAVLAGKADIGIGVGTASAMRAFVDGGPVRVLAPCFTGTDDLYWYVQAASPIQSLKQTTENHTIAFSVPGSSTHAIVLGFANQLGVKARPVSTGGPMATFRTVMAGKADIGWASPPFGLDFINEGKIRMIARGSDVPTTRGQTVRVTVVNANSLRDRRPAVERFMRAYRETLDWMYSDPKALEMYAAKVNLPVRLVTFSRNEFHPKEAMQTDEIRNAEQVMSDAVAVKILKAPLTREQLMRFFPEPGLGK